MSLPFENLDQEQRQISEKNANQSFSSDHKAKIYKREEEDKWRGRQDLVHWEFKSGLSSAYFSASFNNLLSFALIYLLYLPLPSNHLVEFHRKVANIIFYVTFTLIFLLK